MAILRGEQGSVQFDAAGSTNATIVGTRSWSLTTTKETLDVTDHGDTFRSFVGSLISGSGTVELVYDPDATGQAGFLEDVLTTADPADATNSQRSGYLVEVLEQDNWHQAKDMVQGAALVLIAVPIAVTQQVIAQLPELGADTVLADLTSTKTGPLSAMLAKHSGAVVGLHPMFGPDISNIAKQVVVVSHGRDAEKYQWLIQQFTVWGAVLTEKSAQQHDELMQLIQAMRHFSSLVYGVHLAEEQADLQQLLELSSPIYRLELAMVGRLFAQNAELYADIMLSSSAVTGLLQRYQHRFNQLSHLLAARDKEGLMAEFAKGQQFFGPLADQFLQESRRLLQKASDERS